LPISVQDGGVALVCLDDIGASGVLKGDKVKVVGRAAQFDLAAIDLSRLAGNRLAVYDLGRVKRLRERVSDDPVPPF
jgi:hypothetical protein